MAKTLTVLGLAAAVLALYGMTIPAPFIYDDIPHVAGNPAFFLPFKAFWLGLTGRHYFQFASERSYQPLVTLLHFFVYDRPPLCRLIGIALHALNAVLFFAVALRLLAKPKAAALAALLFAVFPLSTEAVNISSFKGHLLAFGLGLGTLLCWISALDGRRLALAAGCVLFALSLLAKETALCALLLMGLYAVFFQEKPLRALRPAIPFLVIAAVYLGLRFGMLEKPMSFPISFSSSPVRSLGWYVQAVLAPRPCLEHDLAQPAWLCLYVIGLAALLYAVRRRRLAAFGLCWALAALLPVLHFISFANLSPVADRYLYLPIAGICLALADALTAGPGVYALYGLLLVWGGLASRRNGLYREPAALFEQTASCAPANPRSHYLLGMHYLHEEQDGPAKAAFERVLALKDGPGTRTIVGDICRTRGEGEEARAHYRRAKALQPDWEKVYPQAAAFLNKR